MLRTTNKAERLTLLHFKTYCKATVIKAVVLACRQTYRPMEWNREPRNKPWSDSFWQGARTVRERTVFSNHWGWENWTSTCPRMKWTVIYSNWLKKYQRTKHKSRRKSFSSEGCSVNIEIKEKRGLCWREELLAFLNPSSWDR